MINLLLHRERGFELALEAYRGDRPVVVFSAESKNLLHGAEDLESMKAAQIELTCAVLVIDGTADDWNASDWPEIFEAARRLWLNGKLPQNND
jgi:hypothetical protein